jgi:hypothetical protein
MALSDQRMQTHSVEPTVGIIPREIVAWDFCATFTPEMVYCSRQTALSREESLQGWNTLQFAHSGTFLSAAHVPVRVAKCAGREGNAF